MVAIPWSASDGFSLGPARQLDLDIMVDGHPRKATVMWRNGPHVSVDGVPAARRACASYRWVQAWP